MLNISNNSDTRAKIFYFNDLHANLKNAKKLKFASDKYDELVKNEPYDSFKFCAGDSYIGRNKSNFIGRFLNLLNLDGMVLGNHEFDMGTKQLSKFMDNNLFKVFTANIEVKENSHLQDEIKSGRLVKSDIIIKNGNKYGIIGATAADIKDTTSKDTQEDCADVEFMEFDDTCEAIQDEVDKLKEQGVNKIILLSHLGYGRDKKLAKKTEGIDIIVGGHSHHSLGEIKPYENLFNSKSGEPVLILQAGQNGEKTGVLDVVFDKNGKVKSATNNLIPTANLDNSLIVEYIEKISCDKLETLGNLTSTLEKMHKGFEEHPLACFVADAMRIKSGAQIALHNKGCQKTDLKAGTITNRDVNTALPYINSVALYKFSEKDVIDVLKASLNAPVDKPDKIGNLQVSGLNYTIGKNGQLKDVYLVEGDKKTKLDENNPSTNKFFTVAYGAFFAGGPDRLKMLRAPEKRIQKFEWDDLQATIELFKDYATKNNGNIEIKPDGRIKIEK